MEKQEIGNRIAQALKIKKMCQKELAEALDVSQSSVTNWIKGYKEISGVTLLKILDILDCYNLFYPKKYMSKKEVFEYEHINEFNQLAKEINSGQLEMNIGEFRQLGKEIDSNKLEEEHFKNIDAEFIDTIAKRVTATIIKSILESKEVKDNSVISQKFIIR